MTEQQFNTLTVHKGIYDLYIQTLTVNGAHPSVNEINNIHEELTGSRFKTSCGACVVDGITTVYNEYNKHKHLYKV